MKKVSYTHLLQMLVPLAKILKVSKVIQGLPTYLNYVEN
jgi:hypothetical protein